MTKCGFIAILGKTNAGKSTLVNKIIGQKVSIVSRKVKTTISKILGILINGETQVILIDTPGFMKKKSGKLEKITWDAFREADHILFVIDVFKKSFDDSLKLLEKIDKEKSVSLVLNKIDLIHKPKLLEIAKNLSEVRNFENIFMTSSTSGIGIKEIKEYIVSKMPDGEWLYPKDAITDSSLEKYSAEITREHIYHRIHQEIPYKCVIETENIEEKEDSSLKIIQNIFVSTDSHKSILIGHNGSKIKAIGSAAREELSELLQTEVHLFLHVFVDKNKCNE